jgi:hypothetical protein
MELSDNVDVVITDDQKLVITIDLNKDVGRTKSGKNIMIASTGGGLQLLQLSGKTILQVNLYKEP